MTIIQTTARVPEEYRDLILRVSARIREDVEFPAKLEALLLETMGAPVAYQLPPDVADTLAALDARVKEIEAQLAQKMAPALAALEAMNAPVKAALARVPAVALPDIPEVAPTLRTVLYDVTPIPATTKRKKPPPTAEQKAERKAFAAELREAPGAQGLGWKALAEKLTEATNVSPASAQNILSGSMVSSPELRNKLRVAVGLEPKEPLAKK